MQSSSSSAPDAALVTTFDRWRQWAQSLRKTSRDNLLTCRADKRAMRHMTILEEATMSSSFGDLAGAETGGSSRARELDLEGHVQTQTASPALRRQPHRESRPAQTLRPPNQAAPRPPTNALTAYPNVDLASASETAMDVVVSAILRPQSPQARRVDREESRMKEAARPKQEKPFGREDDGGGSGLLDGSAAAAAAGRTGSRERGANDDDACLRLASRDLVLVLPDDSPLPRPAAETKETAKVPSSDAPAGDGKGVRGAVPTSATLQQVVGKKVSVVPRSEVVGAYHKGQAVEVVCPCCATSLIALVDPSLRTMIFCPACESIAPCSLCVGA